MIGKPFKSVHEFPSKEFHLDKAQYHLEKGAAYSKIVTLGEWGDDIDEAECMRCTMLHQNLYQVHALEYVKLLLAERNSTFS